MVQESMLSKADLPLAGSALEGSAQVEAEPDLRADWGFEPWGYETAHPALQAPLWRATKQGLAADQGCR